MFSVKTLIRIAFDNRASNLEYSIIQTQWTRAECRESTEIIVLSQQNTFTHYEDQGFYTASDERASDLEKG